ncbi:50S ribosomal protein L21, chloroplastic-like [Zingiber officinale]|uniref:50S ribosomal protein L21, chloroplastic n=1 Tax=Zingiber officinale TaxID=94328 RepID=A0A8J5GIU3_ZINOF|nr:50S ribosomal protein L21, chloroplastic-like [Zingiber officinale]KAG6501647.1 hypothetical protein ZIOFF_041530 [Zingiber officinale]
MASALGAAAVLSPPVGLFSLSRSLPTFSVSSKVRFPSIPTRLSSSQRPFLPLSSSIARKSNLRAAAEEESIHTEDVDPAVPAPVEEQLAASTAAKEEDVFAVVMVGSRQYIVIPGRFLYTQRLKDANVNDKIILNKVLLVGTRTKAYIGQPIVTNAAVHAVVEEQGLDHKVIVFKYKRKKNYRRNIGHRQPRTRIRITGITGYENFPAETMPENVPA